MQPDTQNHAEQKYLLFQVGGELYGAPLTSVREVIKSVAIKTVPYMAPHFLGVINLRGQIVSVIDLRVKLGLSKPKNGQELILIVESGEGLIGAMIDDLLSVREFGPKEVDMHPSLETRMPAQFMIGIAKMNSELVNLIDISGCMSSEDLRLIKKNQVA